MHEGKVTLGGPLWWLAIGLLVFAWLLSAYVMLDSLSDRRKAQFARLPESRFVYAIPSALFVIATLVLQIASAVVRTTLPAGDRLASLVSYGAVAVALAAPLALFLSLAYLLRVRFPGRS